MLAGLESIQRRALASCSCCTIWVQEVVTDLRQMWLGETAMNFCTPMHLPQSKLVLSLTTSNRYKFGDEFFIVFYVKWGYSALQYVLKEPRDGETINSISSYTDKLIKAAGDVLYKQQPGIFVFDNYWFKDHKLYEEVQKASWDKVILDADMKKDLTEVTEKFFDSKDVYDDLGVPWKRGIMFHGPPGNGKTISIKGEQKYCHATAC